MERTLGVSESKIKTKELVERLRSKYSAPAYAFVTEVPDGTGWDKKRTADAIAMGCWKSVEIELQGFEVKVSRADWRKELKDLNKSAAFQKHCHRWWIVAAKGIVKLEEMPAEWGLIEPHGEGLTVKKGASLTTPEPVSFMFLAGLLRKAVAVGLSEQERAEIRRKAFTEAKATFEKADPDTHAALLRSIEITNKSIEDFERLSGIPLTNYNGGQIGKEFVEFKKFKNSIGPGYLRRVMDVANHVAESAKRLEAAITEVVE